MSTAEDPGALAPPGVLTALGEASTGLEWARLSARSISLARRPRGHGEPVRVFPGFGASDGSTVALRRYLRSRSYDAHGWQVGRNNGDVVRIMGELEQRAERVAQAAGQPIHLIGWSLGGVIARELARDRPDLVAQVITLGSPIEGGPRHTTLRWFYPPERIAWIEAQFEARTAVPITVPITAVYSRRDGVVGWRSCLDTTSPNAINVEVRSTHLGMGIDPDVWEIVTERLQDARSAVAA